MNQETQKMNYRTECAKKRLYDLRVLREYEKVVSESNGVLKMHCPKREELRNLEKLEPIIRHYLNNGKVEFNDEGRWVSGFSLDFCRNPEDYRIVLEPEDKIQEKLQEVLRLLDEVLEIASGGDENK